eukprot:s2158_g2.t1
MTCLKDQNIHAVSAGHSHIHVQYHNPSEPLLGPSVAMADAKALRWLNDVDGIRRWLKHPERNLKKLLAKSGGLVKISGFLPPFVADAVLQRLQQLDSWERAGEGDRDDVGYADRVKHRFSIADVEGDELLLGAARVLAKMLPGTLPNFSAACYRGRDHIAPHTDEVPEAYSAAELQRLRAAYAAKDLRRAAAQWRATEATTAEAVQEGLEAALQSGDLQKVRAAVAQRRATESAKATTPWTRWVAAAYYLNKEWKATAGGQFVDMAASKHVLHSPDFNTLVAFEVPRLHAVRALRGRRPRYSLFGWWLRPGARAKGTKGMARPAAKGRKAVKKPE